MIMCLSGVTCLHVYTIVSVGDDYKTPTKWVGLCYKTEFMAKCYCIV